MEVSYHVLFIRKGNKRVQTSGDFKLFSSAELFVQDNMDIISWARIYKRTYGYADQVIQVYPDETVPAWHISKLGG